MKWLLIAIPVALMIGLLVLDWLKDLGDDLDDYKADVTPRQARPNTRRQRQALPAEIAEVRTMEDYNDHTG